MSKRLSCLVIVLYFALANEATNTSVPTLNTTALNNSTPININPVKGTEDRNCTTLDDMLSCTVCVSNNCQDHNADTTTSTTSTTTTTTQPPHTTTTDKPTTTSTTTSTSSTTSTTTTTTTTKVPPITTTSTTSVPPTTTKTTPGTTTSPSHNKSSGFGWGPFFAGIVFTAGVSSVAYVVWRFYKARTERNYHTL